MHESIRAARPRPAGLLAALVAAVQALTRLPVSSAAPPTERVLGWSATFYPLVGLLLAGAGIAVHFVAALLFPPGVTALFVLAVWMLLTGALHEDGLADTFDAFGSQHSKEDILRVMKDSRIGVYGALALGMSLLLRWQALALLPGKDMAFALMASQVIPRTGVVTLARLAGPASGGSGGALAASVRKTHLAVAFCLAAAVLLPFGQGHAIMAVAGLCLAVIGLAALYFRARIGGVTGDCLGAVNQVQEMTVFLTILGLGAVA
jgi:adenosylcobinamide-GDP ribazoletransferase